jgi:prepilin-type N-terminal cleavage/methylation domain-containing protein
MQTAIYKLRIAHCRKHGDATDLSRFSLVAPRFSRRAFTLVELLIVITIIAILAGLVVGVAAVAAQMGREAKTRNIVTRIHTLLLPHYNSYKNRRVELNPNVITAVNTAFPTVPGETGYKPDNGGRRGQALAAARLYALREMMLLEMPDRWGDVTLNQSDLPPAPLYLAQRPPLADVYLRRYAALLDSNYRNKLTGQPNTAAEIQANQSAECLYMIVTIACGDGEAREQFNESDIGDVDGDGAPEFLDAWGHPIHFLRWAPGFDSPAQLSFTRLEEIRLAAIADGEDPDEAVAAAIAADHDPFDMFRVDPTSYRLVPLVYSDGRDEGPGIDRGAVNGIWLPSPSVRFRVNSNPPPHLDPPLDPYATTIGTAIDGSAVDNIHNHLIGQRLGIDK